MTLAAIYVRISSDREGGGLGVERQEKECRELADKLGWDVADVHIDNDVSAYTDKPRPGYKALLADLESGAANAVLAWHTDRLYRRPADLEPLINLAKTKGVHIQTVKAGKLDLSTPTGVLIAGILAEVSRYEITHAQERLRAWHRQRALGGHPHGGIRPFGWQDDRIHKEPDEAAEILRWAVHILAGGSLGDLVRDLNERGVSTVQGGPWGKQQVRAVLTRPRLSGWRVHNGERVAKGQWEPILPDDIHGQIVELLSNPARYTGPATHERRHLLSGLALCFECEVPLTVKTATRRNGKTRRNYWCNTCGMYRTKEPVDAAVEAYIIERLRFPDPADADISATPADTGRLEFLHAKRRAAVQLFGSNDAVSVADQVAMLGSLDAEIAAEQAKLAPPPDTRRRRVLELADPDEFPGYTLARKRSIIDARCEIRLKRQPPGRNGFDPESVVITRR